MHIPSYVHVVLHFFFPLFHLSSCYLPQIPFNLPESSFYSLSAYLVGGNWWEEREFRGEGYEIFCLIGGHETLGGMRIESLSIQLPPFKMHDEDVDLKGIVKQ